MEAKNQFWEAHHPHEHAWRNASQLARTVFTNILKFQRDHYIHQVLPSLESQPPQEEQKQKIQNQFRTGGVDDFSRYVQLGGRIFSTRDYVKWINLLMFHQPLRDEDYQETLRTVDGILKKNVIHAESLKHFAEEHKNTLPIWCKGSYISIKTPNFWRHALGMVHDSFGLSSPLSEHQLNKWVSHTYAALPDQILVQNREFSFEELVLVLVTSLRRSVYWKDNAEFYFSLLFDAVECLALNPTIRFRKLEE
jgi:hypothetical protein